MRLHKWNRNSMTSLLPMPEGVLEPLEFFENRGRFAINFPEVNTSVSEYFFHLEIAVPGYEKEDFDIKVSNKELVISVKKGEEEKSDTKTYGRKEFVKEPFKKTFRLPSSADINKIEAKYRKGILYIDIPKIAKKEIDTKVIEVV